MKRSALVFAAVLSLVAGCTSAQQGTLAVPSGLSIANKTTAGRAHSNLLHPALVSESVLYSFSGGPISMGSDGAFPMSGLVNASGALYGTTWQGGTSNDGTIFKVTTSGAESVLHSFQGPPTDGFDSEGGLDKSARYGTTHGGGAYAAGTVFKITAAGTYKLLYNFAGGTTDGSNPVAGLLNVNGTLYGTTDSGGQYGAGTVFAITPSGTENVLYSFAGSPDGARPLAGLINVNGVFFGTTFAGGASGGGTVFSVTMSGAETVLHSFAGGTADGASPDGGLVNVNDGTLYGTTAQGGASGEGTVFKVKSSGTYKVLHSFGAYPDGENPHSGLSNVNGTLYGTTLEGGANNDGTVYSITKSGTENVLYSFAGGTADGSNPVAGLLNVNGVFYGTTQNGGQYGVGTVYAITP